MGKDALRWYIHVNQHIIRKNIHAEDEDIQAPITVKRGRNGRSATGFNVRIPDGSHVVYDAREPILPCGARLVIVCPSEPEILDV